MHNYLVWDGEKTFQLALDFQPEPLSILVQSEKSGYWLMEGQAALEARKTLAGIEELGGPELHGAKAVTDETLLADLLDMGWLEGEVM